MSQKSVTLPDLPKEHEYEEFIAAILHSCCHSYIERNIIQREKEEILELDILHHSFTNSELPYIQLIEIKSGKWGFPDIFKVKGWMHYLALEHGVFITEKAKDDIEFYKKKSEQIGINLINIPDQKNPEDLLNYFSSRPLNDIDVVNWRFSFWLERNLLKVLKNKKKSIKDKLCYGILDDYFFKINSAIFYSANIIDIIHHLYQNFQKHPYLTAKTGNELLGNNYDDSITTLPNTIFSRTYYDCEFNDIAITTYLEHRSRLAILKNSIEYIIYKKQNAWDKIEEKYEIFNIKRSRLDNLPANFIKKIEEISKNHQYFYLYPVFWQWFLWYFGGFILLDYEEQEYQLLSEKTGIPVDEIDNALGVYDYLFNTPNGWFKTIPNTNIRILNLFSTPFRGIGAHVRKIYYTESSDYDDLKLKSSYAYSDLMKWNNLCFEVLQKKI